jgi:hypothetical protein
MSADQKNKRSWLRRGWFSICRAEAEFANHCEQVNMLGTGGANKKYENQAGFNELFDTGRASKMYRDHSKNYGKDILQMFQRKRDGKPVNKTCFYHTGCMNFAQAWIIVGGKEGLHSMALLERYLMMPLIFINPYDEPPEGYTAPTCVYEASSVINDHADMRELKRDGNGLWRRDLVPAPQSEIQAGMMRVKTFTEEGHNALLHMDSPGMTLFRKVDSINWHAAGILQYVDEDKAAKLRQAQRFLADLSGGHLLLDVMADLLPATARVANIPIEEKHVRRAVCQLAAIWEGHETFITPGRQPYVISAFWEGDSKNLGVETPRAVPASPASGADGSAPAAVDPAAAAEGDGAEVLPSLGRLAPPDIDAEWEQKEWDGATYWQNTITGEWCWYKPLLEPISSDIKTTEDAQKEVQEASPEDLRARGVDEYTLVGILSPDLAEKLRSGVSFDEPDVQDAFVLSELVQSAVVQTLLWTGGNKITGSSVTAAIKANKVPWPSAKWWWQEVVQGALMEADFGVVSEHNFGGGWWCKPPVPDIEDASLPTFIAQLTSWHVSMPDYMSALAAPPRGKKAVGRADSAPASPGRASTSVAAEGQQRSPVKVPAAKAAGKRQRR